MGEALSEFNPDWGTDDADSEAPLEAASTPAIPCFLAQAPALCASARSCVCRLSPGKLGGRRR